MPEGDGPDMVDATTCEHSPLSDFRRIVDATRRDDIDGFALTDFCILENRVSHRALRTVLPVDYPKEDTKGKW